MVVVTLLTSARLSAVDPGAASRSSRLLAKSAGLYDRDQYVLHKTTLDEGPSLLGVAAIVALLTEAIQALDFHGRSQPLLLWAALTVGLVLARATARFLVVRLHRAPSGSSSSAIARPPPPCERKLAGDPALNARRRGARAGALADPRRVDGEAARHDRRAPARARRSTGSSA